MNGQSRLGGVTKRPSAGRHLQLYTVADNNPGQSLFLLLLSIVSLLQQSFEWWLLLACGTEKQIAWKDVGCAFRAFGLRFIRFSFCLRALESDY